MWPAMNLAPNWATLVGALLLVGFSALGSLAETPLDETPEAETPGVQRPTGDLTPGLVEVDRIVAVVDQDPIFASDLERLVALGLVEAKDGESSEALRRRVLDSLIDQRLQLHVVERYAFGPIPSAELDRQVEILRGQEGGAEALQRRLDDLGMDEASLRLLLSRQLRVLVYVEERLGPKVFIEPDEVLSYYQTTLLPTLAQQGVDTVPFEDVADDIRSLLREEQLNNEIDRWTQELRLEAEVIDLFERLSRPLPPVVDRLQR